MGYIGSYRYVCSKAEVRGCISLQTALEIYVRSEMRPRYRILLKSRQFRSNKCIHRHPKPNPSKSFQYLQITFDEAPWLGKFGQDIELKSDVKLRVRR